MVEKKLMDEVYRNLKDHGEDEVDQLFTDMFGTADKDEIARKFFAEMDLTKLKSQVHLLNSYTPDAHTNSGDPERRPITQAWEVEAERLAYALMISQPQVKLELGTPYHNREDGTSYGNTSMHMRYLMFQTMLAAVPYLWRTEIMKKAEMLPIPRHTIPENLLPYPHMYWSWQTGFDNKTWNAETGEQLQVDADGMLIWYTPPDHIQACLVGIPPGPYQQHIENPVVSLISVATIRVGSTWPDDFDKDTQRTIAPILAKLAFLNSQYVADERQRLPRPMRRGLAGASVADPDPVIHVVSLRPSATPRTVGGDSERKFHHQWWVRGHIRAQWHPSIKGHKLIWIDEHLKGPNDAPMISKIYDVNR